MDIHPDKPCELSTYATVGWTKLTCSCKDSGNEYCRVLMADWPVFWCENVAKFAPRREFACETVILTEAQSPAGENGVDTRLLDASQELNAEVVSEDGATKDSTFQSKMTTKTSEMCDIGYSSEKY